MRVRTLETLEDLDRYVRDPSGAACALQLDGVSSADARRWEARLSRLGRACGCVAGTVVAILTAVVFIWHYRTTGAALSSVGMWATSTAWVLTASLVAKFFALFLARWRLRWLGAELKLQCYASAREPGLRLTPP